MHTENSSHQPPLFYLLFLIQPPKLSQTFFLHYLLEEETTQWEPEMTFLLRRMDAKRGWHKKSKVLLCVPGTWAPQGANNAGCQLKLWQCWAIQDSKQERLSSQSSIINWLKWVAYRAVFCKAKQCDQITVFFAAGRFWVGSGHVLG